MVFKRGGILPIHKWFYGESELEITKYFKYLGIVFTTDGSFSEAPKILVSQAEKAFFSLYKSKFVNLSPDFMLDLFDKLIQPVLSYEVWGFHTGSNIE